jgi:recombination protein RecA
MGQGLRKIVSLVNKSHISVIFVNQVRDKIGVVWGNPETTPGGNALKFYASQRIRSSIAGKNKDKEDNIISVNTKIKVVKNKIAPPFKETLITIKFGKGIDLIQEIVNICVELDIIHKSGSWYSYDETKLGQGEAGVKELIEDNPEFLEELKLKIKEQWI